jgi:phospholipid/cholesterol/gamma-HCH transport system substrate-binding protein
METRANYVLIGVVTLIAILAGLGFFLWLAKVQLDRAYASYDILFDSAAGLGQASPVRFNGVDVGQVTAIELDRANPTRVRVRIQVGATTPVREGTQAVLQSQGVTGVSFVGLEGGRPDAPRLQPDPETDLPIIPSKPSVVQGLIDDAPDLLQEAISLLRDLNKFTNDENREAIASILQNLDQATGRLDAAMTDLNEITDGVSDAVEKISGFTEKLDTVATNANTVLDTANSTLRGFDAFSNEGLPRITSTASEASRLIDSLRRLSAQIERDPARFFLGNRTPEYNR